MDDELHDPTGEPEAPLTEQSHADPPHADPPPAGPDPAAEATIPPAPAGAPAWAAAPRADEPATEPATPVEPSAEPRPTPGGATWSAGAGTVPPGPRVAPPPVAGGGSHLPPAPPPPGRPGSGSRPSGWRQFLVGSVVGALVGGGVAAGVAVATRDDTTSSRTVVVGATSRPVQATSVIGKADNVQAVVARVEPAVVAIQTGSGAGTGFVISKDGVIVTNDHVIEGAGGRIEVQFSDGTSESAKLLGQASEYDLAVLKVEGSNLPTLTLGSSDQLTVGDQVVAVGNALALEGGLTVTQGIISGKGRVVPEDQTGVTLYDMLQTDAAINPGNSGGPLVNAKGEVVGINTALAGGSQNVGFAISIDSAKAVIDELRAGRDVAVAFLGVETSEVTPSVARSLGLENQSGALVRNVTSGTAADDAGIRSNDVLIEIGGRQIRGPEDVGAAIRRFQPGDDVDVVVERDGQSVSLPVTLGTRPDRLG